MLLLLARLGMVAVVTVAGWMVLRAFAGDVGFPPDPMIATLGLLPVNVGTLLLLRRVVRARGSSLRELIGHEPGTWGRETAWGLLWVMVLFVPFVLAIMGTMWLIHGADMFVAFETVFYDPDAVPTVPAALSMVLGAVAFVTFAPLNAPAEELLYRGYAQSHLSRVWPTAVAIVVCSVAFGVQHAFFAPTPSAVAVYVAAFTAWGLGSALIVRWQRRLMPIVVAHLFVNVMTSAPAIVVPALVLAGVFDPGV